MTAEEYTGPSEFVHLHNHTLRSTLDGVASADQYAAECHKRGYPAMSATEHGHMGSVPDMHFAFKKYGLKAIVGCEPYYNDYEPERKELTVSMKSVKESDPDFHARIMRNRHLTVLAKNEVGVSNLLKLTTQAHKTGHYYRPRIWFDKLCEFKEGLIILSGCLNGPVCHELRLTDKDGKRTPRWESKDKRGAIDYLKKFKKAFGENYKVELQMPGIPGDDFVFRQSVALADALKIDTVITNDCHYLTEVDHELQMIMMAIDQKTTVDDPNMFHVNSSQQYMKTRAELWATFKNGGYSRGIDDGVFERSCDNTLKIAEMCENRKVDSWPKMPSLDNADNRLAVLLARKLHAFFRDNEEADPDERFLIDGRHVTYLEQMKLEYERIVDKGYSSYFLITEDLISYGTRRGWPFSPRGSAGGSLVNFLLGISSINPMHWGLSFNRFLSPSRGGFLLNVKMPEAT